MNHVISLPSPGIWLSVWSASDADNIISSCYRMNEHYWVIIKCFGCIANILLRHVSFHSNVWWCHVSCEQFSKSLVTVFNDCSDWITTGSLSSHNLIVAKQDVLKLTSQKSMKDCDSFWWLKLLNLTFWIRGNLLSQFLLQVSNNIFERVCMFECLCVCHVSPVSPIINTG